MPPMPELKRDMELLKRNGFNLVKLQMNWMLTEPREGQCDFSRYEELIEHASRLDLGVYIGLVCELAPPWLYARHPDCRMVGRDGRVIAYEAPTTLPADGKPGPCYDHPGAMADQLRFIGNLVATLGRFENIVIWNIWQEIAYWAEGIVGNSICFCPHTLAAFRDWLRARHGGNLEALNRAWNTRYPDWEAIQPSRAGRQPQAVDIQWQTFMDNAQIGNILQRRAAAVRAADPLGRPVFAHKNTPSLASGQDWTYARAQDFLGTSTYPAWTPGHAWDDGQTRPFRPEHALLAEMWDGVAYRFEYVRSANPGKGRPGGVPIWGAEFQGGPISAGLHMGRVPAAEDIRRWVLTAAASGATAISFWNTRAEIMAGEQNGFGLLDSVGDETARFAEAGRIGRALNRHPELFARPTLAPARVGLLIDEANYQLTAHLAQGGEHLPYDIRGWYRLLWDLNIPVDFVNMEHDLEIAGSYAVLILPFPLALAETTAEQLVRYVERGGHLICEAAPGRMSEHAFCARGEVSPAMAALFGIRQKRFMMIREPESGARWSPPERTWGEYLEAALLTGQGPLADQSLRANVYLQTFDCLDGAEPVLAAGDDVAGVRRRHGAGAAWLLGTYLGHSGTAYRDPAVHAGIRNLLAACGVTPTHAGCLLLRKRMVPGKEAWFLTNPTAEPVRETVATPRGARVSDLLDEPLEYTEAGVTITVGALDVRVLIVGV